MGDDLSAKQIDAICRRVYGRYPAIRGARPRVQRQSMEGKERFLLRFQKTVSLPDGKKLPHTVRVVADANGRILKLTLSR